MIRLCHGWRLQNTSRTFQVDLYEGKNLNSVQKTILNLAAVSRDVPSFKGYAFSVPFVEDRKLKLVFSKCFQVFCSLLTVDSQVRSAICASPPDRLVPEI